MLFQVLLGMLALVTSKKVLAEIFSEGANLFLNGETPEDKQKGFIKLSAGSFIFMEKFGSNPSKESIQQLLQEFGEINEKCKSNIPSEEEMNDMKSFLSGMDIKENDSDEEDEEFHVHDCDTCGGKGDCPIEDVMRQVKSGTLTPKEGEEKVNEIISKLDSKPLGNKENSDKVIILPSVVGEA